MHEIISKLHELGIEILNALWNVDPKKMPSGICPLGWILKISSQALQQPKSPRRK